MEVYAVGGAVRDKLLAALPGREALPGAAGDRDWVVVGATPAELLSQGFLPVGRDFPVFLHPTTREEHALARTERKSAPGYHGFQFSADPSVTLAQDLARRDLTINAMAEAADGTLVDPYGGRRDLAARTLRHVSPAFAEDPVRILRLARFAARWPDFRVADATLELAREMVRNGEVEALVPERVWQELARGLMEARPSRMFDVLRGCGAAERLLPEIDRLWSVPAADAGSTSAGDHLMRALDGAAQRGATLAVRFGCLCHDLGNAQPGGGAGAARDAQPVSTLALRLRAPSECREVAELVAREHAVIEDSADLDATALLQLFERCDALRRPQRFDHALLACEAHSRGRVGAGEAPFPPRQRLMGLAEQAGRIDTAQIAADAAARGLRGPAVGAAIRHARWARLEAALAAPG